MKPPKHYTATVFRQAPAVNEQAQFLVVGQAAGTHDEIWQQAKAMTQFPVIQFKEVSNASQVHH